MEHSRRKTSVEWPSHVDDRLRGLVALAEQTGQAGKTSASELLAALICTHPCDAPRLARTLRRYRKMSPDDIAAKTQDNVRTAPRARRGRPRRRVAAPGAEDPR